jgi:serine protease inhibitor
MLTSFTSFCQTDTTKTRKDSLEKWIPFIVKDLKDYDLVKQKSYYQEQKIKSLEEITNTQKNLSIRQSISLESYLNYNLKIQSINKNLETDLKENRKKLIKSRLENWSWRAISVGAIYFLFLR